MLDVDQLLDHLQDVFRAVAGLLSLDAESVFQIVGLSFQLLARVLAHAHDVLKSTLVNLHRPERVRIGGLVDGIELEAEKKEVLEKED